MTDEKSENKEEKEEFRYSRFKWKAGDLQKLKIVGTINGGVVVYEKPRLGQTD